MSAAQKTLTRAELPGLARTRVGTAPGCRSRVPLAGLRVGRREKS